MDRFLLSYIGNKYQDSKKHLDINTEKYAYILEPFGGIFGFSRFTSIKNKNCKFLINDIDSELIEIFKMLKNDLTGTIQKVKDEAEKYKENIKMTRDNHKSKILTLTFSGLSPLLMDIPKGNNKIKNFLKKKIEYEEFFKRCEFYNMPAIEFMKKFENLENSLWFFDPPYFNSNNVHYNDYFRNDKGYHDGTGIYIDILKWFESGKNCIFIMNKLELINHLFKRWFYKEYCGVYGSRKIKKHVIYISPEIPGNISPTFNIS